MDDYNLENYSTALFDSTVRTDTHHRIDIYVDGSYNSKTDEFSYGMVIFDAGQKYIKSKKFKKCDYSKYKNVSGEIFGAIEAMLFAKKHSATDLYIYYDYNGIKNWCTRYWKANTELSRKYKKIYDSFSSKMKIRFIKVKSHKNEINIECDKLAKEALKNKEV